MIRIILISAVLVFSLTGCLTSEEEKAKDIMVKKIIHDEAKREALIQSMRKKDTTDYVGMVEAALKKEKE